MQLVVRSDCKRTTSYVPQLTWLRGLAALFVIISHSIRATEVSYGYGDEEGSSWLNVFDLGAFGVVCFFALSGSTLYLSRRSNHQTIDLCHFYSRRFFRIWPAFIISMFIYIAFGYAFRMLYGTPRQAWVEQSFYQSYSYVDCLTYSLLAFNLTGPQGLFNSAYWSLPVEFQYYLLFPLLVWSIPRFGYYGPLLSGAFAILLTKIGAVHFFDSVLVFKLAFTFCGGIVIADVFKRTNLRLSNAFGLGVFFLSVSLAILVTHLPNEYLIKSPLPEKWILFGCLSLTSVAAALFTDIRFSPMLEKILGRLGTTSYSLYLYHNLFIALAVLVLIRFQVVSGPLKVWLVICITLPLSIMAAELSYRYVELAGINFSRRATRNMPPDHSVADKTVKEMVAPATCNDPR